MPTATETDVAFWEELPYRALWGEKGKPEGIEARSRSTAGRDV